MCVRLPGCLFTSEYLPTPQKASSSLKLASTITVLFGSAEFTIDAYSCRAQGTQSASQVSMKAQILSWNMGRVMCQEPGRDPVKISVTQSNTTHDTLFLKI